MPSRTDRQVLIIHPDPDAEGRHWELYTLSGTDEPGFLSPGHDDAGNPITYMLQKLGAHLDAQPGLGTEWWTVITYVHPALQNDQARVGDIARQFLLERLSKHEPELVTYSNSHP